MPTSSTAPVIDGGASRGVRAYLWLLLRRDAAERDIAHLAAVASRDTLAMPVMVKPGQIAKARMPVRQPRAMSPSSPTSRLGCGNASAPGCRRDRRHGRDTTIRPFVPVLLPMQHGQPAESSAEAVRLTASCVPLCPNPRLIGGAERLSRRLGVVDQHWPTAPSWWPGAGPCCAARPAGSRRDARACQGRPAPHPAVECLGNRRADAAARRLRECYHPPGHSLGKGRLGRHAGE